MGKQAFKNHLEAAPPLLQPKLQNRFCTKKQDQHSELIDCGFKNQNEGFKKIIGALDKHTLLFEFMIG